MGGWHAKAVLLVSVKQRRESKQKQGRRSKRDKHQAYVVVLDIENSSGLYVENMMKSKFMINNLKKELEDKRKIEF